MLKNHAPLEVRFGQRVSVNTVTSFPASLLVYDHNLLLELAKSPYAKYLVVNLLVNGQAWTSSLEEAYNKGLLL